MSHMMLHYRAVVLYTDPDKSSDLLEVKLSFIKGCVVDGAVGSNFFLSCERQRPSSSLQREPFMSVKDTLSSVPVGTRVQTNSKSRI